MILYRLTGSDLWLLVRKAKKKRNERKEEHVVCQTYRTEGDRNGNDNTDDKQINAANWFLNGQTIYSTVLWTHAERSICRFLWTKIDSLYITYFFFLSSNCSLILCSMVACCVVATFTVVSSRIYHFLWATNEHRPLMTFETNGERSTKLMTLSVVLVVHMGNRYREPPARRARTHTRPTYPQNRNPSSDIHSM